MIIKNVLSAVSIFTVMGLSMATSVFGFGKISNQLQKPLTDNIVVPEVKGTSTVDTSAEVEGQEVESSNNTSNKIASSSQSKLSSSPKTLSQNSTPTPTPTPKLTATPTPTPTPSPTPTPTPSNKCIVTLFGLQYDVTALANSHSGGNIFVCGTDMTVTYQSQHGTNVSRMTPYLVTSSPTPTPTPTPSSSPTPKPGTQYDDDRDDDHDDEDRYEHEREYDHDDEHEDDHDLSMIFSVIS